MSKRVINILETPSSRKRLKKHRVVELFAGVGGFRLGLERSGWEITWSNQWEPSTKVQHASDCYINHFGNENHFCRDIKEVLDDVEEGSFELPSHELLVGGFPCQDYSVARTLNQAVGIQGKKGVLWWEIYRLIQNKLPPLLLLENVDRLLNSPANQRGRDFGIILSCLNDLGYSVEWRIINAAKYGFPQKRRRVFIVGYLESLGFHEDNPMRTILEDGILARSFPVQSHNEKPQFEEMMLHIPHFEIKGALEDVSGKFGQGLLKSYFLNAGFSRMRRVWTWKVKPKYSGKFLTLRDMLLTQDQIDKRYLIPDEDLERWKYLKGAKKEERVHMDSGTSYHYAEGAIPFPDNLDQPSRTILTGEGGITPSRFKHIIETPDGGYRRLTPVELERLNGFPDDWTNTGLSDGRRAFMMGNALVVGVVERIGKVLSEAF